MNVRKDIETEHNVVVAELTDNIAHLKDMLQQQQQQPQQQSHFSPQQQRANHFSPPNLPQPSHPHQHQSQRGVRSSTPPSTYEDTLLEALQHQDESHLVRFLEEAPERRIQAIFHSGPKPPLSQAVILSLMHRLVKPLPQRRGPLDQQDNVRLKWFRACLQGIDFDDGETADYIPRILDVTSNALSATQPRLISAGDMTGLGATQDLVNTLQYYSRR